MLGVEILMVPAPSPVSVILVVDDDPLVANALAGLMARDDRRVVVTFNPLTALGLVEREGVDLVFTDRQMPGMSGHQLVAALHARFPDVPCVMLTGTPSLDSALEAINKGQVVRYLTKPCNESELEDTIAAGLARRAELRGAAVRDGSPTMTTVPSGIGMYTISGTLGEGGMGTVYRAQHEGLGRPVAIKVLRAAGARDPTAMARFAQEAKAATRARHPRIVETLDYGHLPDGRAYLVMELVEAETLWARLERGPLSPLDAVHIARGIAEALAAAHAVDVVHRDLKPGNVFVDAQLEVKLGDFGAAKLLDLDEGITRADMSIGTPLYMAPEQILNHAVDGRTDIYALGCVLYRMLTGGPPYAGPDSHAVLAQHLHATVPEPTSMFGALPRALIDVVQAAMAKDAIARPQTADNLITRLDRAAAALADDSKG